MISICRLSLSLRSVWRGWLVMWVVWPPRPVWTPASPTSAPWWSPTSTASWWRASPRPRTATRLSAATSSKQKPPWCREVLATLYLLHSSSNQSTQPTTYHHTQSKEFSDELRIQISRIFYPRLTLTQTEPFTKGKGGRCNETKACLKIILSKNIFWNMLLLKISQFVCDIHTTNSTNC